jgi:UPF0755 protein
VVQTRPGTIGRALRVLLCALAGLGAALAADAWWQLHRPLNLAQSTTIDLPSGQGFDRLLEAIARQQVFTSRRQRIYLSLYARAAHLTAAAKAGEYALDPGQTPLGLLALLLSGKTVLHELRLIEGWRFAQAWKAIQDEPNLNHSLAGSDADAEAAAVMQALGRDGQSPEGRFFPDTYRFPRNTTDLALLRQAYAAMERTLAAEWDRRDPGLPYDSPEQALIMASIVEKETGMASERAAVAGVFVRRLRLGMRLQTDPTVIYGLGAGYDGNIHSRDLSSDTPYNTYTRDGLPPTPIWLP